MRLIAPIYNNSLPFVFLPAYADFICSSKNEWVEIIEGEDFIVPIRLTKIGPYVSGQLLFYPVRKNGENITAEEEKVFWEEVLLFLDKEKVCIRLTAPSTYFCCKAYPSKSKYCAFGDYEIYMADMDIADLFKAIHPKHRNVIRNAEKNGVVIKYGKDILKDFYAIYESTMHREKKFCDTYDFFNGMFDSLGENNIVCGVAYYMDKPLGGLFMPYTLYGGHYLYGASAERVEVTGAINFLHWTTIQLLKKKMVKRYSFSGARLSNIAGTKYEGIQKFKMRFGGNLNEGYLWKTDVNPLKCILLNNMLNVKFALRNHKPALDIIDRENDKIQ
jgi:hypothetical protein